MSNEFEDPDLDAYEFWKQQEDSAYYRMLERDFEKGMYDCSCGIWG